jgi:hypothetical protein
VRRHIEGPINPAAEQGLSGLAIRRDTSTMDTMDPTLRPIIHRFVAQPARPDLLRQIAMGLMAWQAGIVAWAAASLLADVPIV